MPEGSPSPSTDRSRRSEVMVDSVIVFVTVVVPFVLLVWSIMGLREAVFSDLPCGRRVRDGNWAVDEQELARLRQIEAEIRAFYKCADDDAIHGEGLGKTTVRLLKSYKHIAWLFASLVSDQDGHLDPGDDPGDPEEWWGSVMERFDIACKSNPVVGYDVEAEFIRATRLDYKERADKILEFHEKERQGR